MKKFNLFFFGVAIAAFMFNSCSIERRYHRTGFNVNWNNTSVRMKTDKHHQSASEEIASEEVATVDKKSNKSAVNVVSNYTDLNESAVAVSSNDITSVMENSVNEAPSIANPSISKESVKLSKSVSNNNDFKSSIESRKGTQKLIMKAKNKVLNSGASSPEPWVYALLILLVPFGTTISMFLYEGSWTKRVTVNLILTMLCGIPGLIHALVIIFGNK